MLQRLFHAIAAGNLEHRWDDSQPDASLAITLEQK